MRLGSPRSAGSHVAQGFRVGKSLVTNGTNFFTTHARYQDKLEIPQTLSLLWSLGGTIGWRFGWNLITMKVAMDLTYFSSEEKDEMLIIEPESNCILSLCHIPCNSLSWEPCIQV